MKFPTRGVYAITQTTNKNSDLVIAEVYAALKGGVSVIQYRDKAPDDAIYLAKELLKICHSFASPLIINDDAQLAQQVGADGVHLGQTDGEIANARKLLGDKAIIGVSCYDDILLAREAESQGVNYVAFGRFFSSSSKPSASPASIETLHQAKQCINVPIVAIGGILPENATSLLNAGADILAVIGGIFDKNPEQSAFAYNKLFNSSSL